MTTFEDIIDQIWEENKDYFKSRLEVRHSVMGFLYYMNCAVVQKKRYRYYAVGEFKQSKKAVILRREKRLKRKEELRLKSKRNVARFHGAKTEKLIDKRLTGAKRLIKLIDNK